MKKSIYFFVVVIIAGMLSCERDLDDIKIAKNDPVICFSVSSPVITKAAEFGRRAPISPEITLKSQIADGAHRNIYGILTSAFWWTQNEELINWQLTGPNGLDSTITNANMFVFTFQDLGDYNMRAYRNPPYGFEWTMTITVHSSIDEAVIVEPEFMGSQWLSPSNVFRYYWRVEAPVILNGSETLFRVQGLSEVEYDPFPVFYNQVAFSADNSYIEWHYDYPASGINWFGAKTNVGYVNASSEEIWLTIDPDSPWRCQDPIDNNVIEGIHYNGHIGYLGTVFSPPAGVQTSAGDYNNPVPVVLLSYPENGEIPLHLLCNENTSHWRHRLETEDVWTIVPITQSGGRINPILPAHSVDGQRLVQYGRQIAETWENDVYMQLSSMYVPAIQAFRFSYGSD